MTSLVTLKCDICGGVSPLDVDEVVAAAEISTFIDAHALHDRLAVEMVMTSRPAVV